MNELAAKIRNNLDALANQYDRRLRDLPGYADMPTEERLEAARNAFHLVAVGLETGEQALFTEFIQAVADERVAQGFRVESVQQATTALVEIVEPMLNSVETASFLWRMLVQVNATLAEASTEKVRQAEDRFRRLAENTRDGVTIIEGNQVVYVNDRLCEILGYSKDELVQMSSLDFAAPEEKERLQGIIATARQSSQALEELEFWAVRKDGSRRYLRNRYSMSLKGGEVAGRFVFTTDLTDRRQADEVLAEQQRFLQKVVDLNPSLISIKDREGRFVMGNQVLADVYGTTVEDLIGKSDADFTTPEQAAQLHLDDLEVMDSLQERRLPDRTLTDAQGNLRWVQAVKLPLVDDDGVARHVLGVSSDITELKRAADSLARERNLLRTLIDNIPDFIYIKDSESRFLMANIATARLMGAETADDLLSKSDFDFYEKSLAAEYRADELAIMESGQALLNKDEPHTDKSGKTTWILTSKIPVQDSQGELIGLVGISRDVTQRRLLEQQIHESLERRTQEVRISTEVAQEIAGAPVLDELYQRVVTLVKERFGYYHAQIFRHDQELDAMVVVEGYGKPGEKMKAAGHSLPYGRGVVGMAAASGEPVLASDTSVDPNWVPQPDLPDTHGELAVPIKLRDQVLGVLDVQSDTAGALNEEDQVLLQGLAGQIASAIESTQALERASIFRQFVEASAQGFGMATLDGSVIYSNPVLAHMLGVDAPDVLLGRNIASFYPPDLVEQLQKEALPAVMTQGVWTGELPLVSPQGEVTLAIQSMFLIRNDEGVPVNLANVVTDITERKRAETLLNTRIQVLDCLGDIGRMIDQSPELDEFLPWVAERTAMAFQYPDLCRIAIEFEGQIYGAAQAAKMSHQMVGSLRVGGASAGKIHVAYTEERSFLDEESSLLGDITRRVSVYIENRRLFRQTQEALSEMEASQAELRQVTALQRAILDYADYALIATTPEGTIVTFNPAAERMLGYAAEEVVGLVTPEIIHDLDEVVERAQLFSEDLGYAIEPGFEVFVAKARHNLPNQYEWTYIRKDGSRFPVQLAVTALRDAQDNITGFLGIAQDISERRRSELEMQETLQELERLYRTMSREGWDTYQRESEAAGYLYDRVDIVAADDVWLPEIGLAVERQSFVAPDPGNGSAAVAPLSARGEVFGALGVRDDPMNPLSPEDLALVESVAEQVAQALESARLFEQTQTTLAETEALYQVGRLITAAQNVDEVLAAVLEYVHRFDVDRCLIALLDDPDAVPSDRQAEVHSVWDRKGEEAAFLGNRFTSEHIPVIARLGPADRLVVTDFATSDQVDERTRATFQYLGVGAAAIVPLAVGGRLLGWLLAETVGRPRVFSDQEMEALQSVAGQAAVAVQSARRLEETQIRAEELTVLNELGQALTARLDVQEVLHEAYQQASRLLDATNFYVALYNPEQEEFSFVLMITESEIDRQISTMPVSQGLTGYMIRNRTSLLFEDNVRERQEALGIPLLGEEAQSWLGVPMVVGDRVLGTLAVASFATPRLYDEHDRDLLMAIASPTAIAIENALLLEQARSRAARERLVRVITHRVRQGAGRDLIMRTALRELSEMLGSSKAVIRLGTQGQLLSSQDGGARPGQED